MPPDHVIKMFRRVSYKQHPLIKRVSRCNMSYNGLLFSLVGVTRLELATSRPPDAYSNQLSYTPLKYCVRDEIRTHTAFRPLPPQSSVSTNSTTRTFADIIDAGLRAKNGTRTRDPDLGKVVLYQLSYFRIILRVFCFREVVVSVLRVQNYCLFPN